MIYDFQKKEWKRFFETDIYEVFREFEFTRKNIHVSATLDAHKFLRAKYSPEYRGSITEPLLYNLQLSVIGDTDEDASSITFRNVKAFELPILTNSGFVINGCRRNLVSDLCIASGWYLREDGTGKSLALMRYATPQLNFKKTKDILSLNLGKDAQYVSIFKFLKAINPIKTYRDILEELHELPIAYDTYFREYADEPSAEQCAREVLLTLGDTTLHDDPLSALRIKLFESSYLKIGRERVKRFMNFQSFSKAEGLILAESVTAGDRVFKAGDIISQYSASLLDSSDVKEVTVILNNLPTVLYKCCVQPKVTYDEIICAIYYYCLYEDGLGSADKIDNHCNKVLVPVSIRMQEFVEDYLNTLRDKLIKRIDSGDKFLRSLFDDKMREDLDMSRSIISKITESPRFQVLDDINSLACFDQAFRISSGGDGDNVPHEARDVQKSQFARVCHSTTSESKKVGQNLSLAVMADIDEYGFITAKFRKIKNGMETNEYIDLSPIDERNHVIAPVDADLTQARSEEELQGLCLGCRVNGEQVDAKYAEIDFQDLTPTQVVGPLVSFIPAFNHNAGKRLVMGTNALKQAFPVLKRQRPWITTGIEALFSMGVITGRDIVRYALDDMGHFGVPISEDCIVILSSMGRDSDRTIFIFTSDHPLLSVNGAPSTIVYDADYMKGTVARSTMHYRLRVKDSKVYNMSEIVLHANDVDVKPAKITNEAINLGTQTIDRNKLAQSGLALGQNVRVLFKSYEGFGYEDSVIVDEDFAKSLGLACQNVVTLREDLQDWQIFSKPLTEDAFLINENGLPSIGAHIKVGQTIIGKVSVKDQEMVDRLKGKSLSEKRSMISHSNCTKYDSSKRIEPGDEGIVISANIYETSSGGCEAVVTMGNIISLDVGDKITGMHGNKGVVGLVVPHSRMPFFSDGSIADIIVNPLGVVSRANIGQLIEHLLAGIGSDTQTVQILEPFSSMSISTMIARADELGICEMDVYDGRTGRKFPRKAYLGVMNMLRLEHTSTSKFRAGSSCLDKTHPRTGQPIKGDGGGQRISELSTWCYQTYGASATLETLMSVQSDDMIGKNRLIHAIKAGETNTERVDYNSPNVESLQAYFRAYGVNIVGDGVDTWLDPISSELSYKICNGTCNMELDKKDILRDPEVFGKSGTFNHEFVNARKKYGRLDLMCDVVMPIFLFSDDFSKLFLYRYRSTDKKTGDRKLEKPKAMSTDFIKKAIIAEKKAYFDGFIEGFPVFSEADAGSGSSAHEKDFGINGIMQMIKGYDIQRTVDYCEAELCSKIGVKTFSEIEWNAFEVGNSKLTDLLKIRDAAALFTSKRKISDFITDSIIVPPIGFRPMYEDNVSTAFDMQISRIVGQILILKKKIGTPEQYTQISYIYKLICSFLEKEEDKKKKSIFQEMTDHKTKHSIIRDTLLSKRVTHSGRTEISVDPTLNIDEVGIPLPLASKVFEDHLIARISTTKYLKELSVGKDMTEATKSYRKIFKLLSNNNVIGFRPYSDAPMEDLQQTFNNCKVELKKMLTALFKIYPALLNREPSLHKFNIEGFIPVVVEGYSIHLHPLACHGFNADFDGDCMTATFPQHMKAINEVKQKMMMSQNLINPKDGEIICSLNQDIILGIYWASIFHNNTLVNEDQTIRAVYKIQANYPWPEFNRFNNLAFQEIWDDLDLGRYKLQDTIVVTIDDRKYKSTAGRILINSLISGQSAFLTEKGDDGYNKLKVDKIVTKKSIMKIVGFGHTVCRSEIYTGDNLPNLLDRFMKFGFYMADMSGITLSLFDFHRINMLDKIGPMISEVNDKVSEIHRFYDEGFITETERKDTSVTEWQALKTKLEPFILKNIDRDENVFMIVDSGARGSTNDLMTVCGIIGNVTNTAGEILEVPIRSNYVSGLSANESFQNSFSSRRAIIAAQMSTKDAGETTRKLIYTVEHQRISESKLFNCSAEPTCVKLDYDVTVIPDDSEIASGVFTREQFDSDSDFENWDKLNIFLDKQESGRVITEKVLAFLNKTKLSKLYVANAAGDVVTAKVQYALTAKSRSILWMRCFAPNKLPVELRNEFVLMKEVGAEFIVTDGVIDLVQKYLFDRMWIYTIIGCDLSHGICRRCYGAKYDTHQLPAPLEYGGYQSVQAIGEPTAQLILDSHKNSGAGTDTSGLQRFNMLFEKTSVSGIADGYVSLWDGIVSVDKDADVATFSNVYVTNSAGKFLVGSMPTGTITVVDGEYAQRGEVVCSIDIDYNRLAKIAGIKAARYRMWMDYLQTYEQAGVMARNFELIVLSQSEFGVAHSDSANNDIYMGTTYPIEDLNAAKVEFTPSILKYESALNLRRKVFADIAKGNQKKRIGYYAINKTLNYRDSCVGKTLLGIPTSKASKPIFGMPILKTTIDESQLVNKAKSSRDIFEKFKKPVSTVQVIPTKIEAARIFGTEEKDSGMATEPDLTNIF